MHPGIPLWCLKTSMFCSRMSWLLGFLQDGLGDLLPLYEAEMEKESYGEPERTKEWDEAWSHD